MLTPSPEVIDPQIWQELLALGGHEPEAMVEELLDMYLEDIPRQKASIMEACHSRNYPALAATAHALRSPSASLGALRLADHCRCVELAARPLDSDPTKDPEPLDSLIEPLLREIDRVVACFASLRRLS
jgi:HPt (histidine-containing phosphotransfer) domain-containing protein